MLSKKNYYRFQQFFATKTIQLFYHLKKNKPMQIYWDIVYFIYTHSHTNTRTNLVTTKKSCIRMQLTLRTYANGRRIASVCDFFFNKIILKGLFVYNRNSNISISNYKPFNIKSYAPIFFKANFTTLCTKTLPFDF